MALTQISTDGIKNGTITGTDLATNIDLVDNQRLRLGTGNDLQIYHDSTDSRIANTTGNLIISDTNGNIALQAKIGEESVKCIADAAVELYYDNTRMFRTYASGVIGDQNIWVGSDNYKLLVGGSADLQIYHDGSNSYIDDAGTGALNIRTNNSNINFKGAGSFAHDLAIFKSTEGVELFYNNSKKFETTSGGGTLTGDWSVTNDFFWFDNGEAVFGSGGDLKIYHNGSNSYIDNGTGNLYFRGSNGQMLFRPNNSEDALVLKPNGAVELYYDNSKKFETTTTGTTVQGGIRTSGHTVISGTPHNYFYGRGTQGGGLSVYTQEAALELVSSEDGTHGGSLLFRTVDDGAGFVYNPSSNALELKLFTTSADDFLIHGAGSNLSSLDTQLRVVKDGAVELYHNGSKKFETQSSGVTLFGDLYGGDNVVLRLGNASSGDLQIYHDGSNSRIHDGGTGVLAISGSQVHIQNAAQSENCAKFIQNGAVELYYDNNKKLETTSEGIEVTSNSTVVASTVKSTGSARADMRILAEGTGEAYLWFDASNGDLSGADYAFIQHQNSSLDLIMANYANDVIIKTRNGSIGSGGLNTAIHCTENGEVALYHDGTEKFETTSDGVNLVANRLQFQGQSNRHIKYRSGENDVLYEFDSGDFYRQNIGSSRHEFFAGNVYKLGINTSGLLFPNTGTLSQNAMYFETGQNTGDYATMFGVTNYPDASGFSDQNDGHWAKIKSKGGCVVIINSDGGRNDGRNNYDHFSVYHKEGESTNGKRAFSVDHTGGIQCGQAGINIDREWGNQPSFSMTRDCNDGTNNTDDSAYFRFHGTARTHSSWTGGSNGNDFSANMLLDGGNYNGSDRRTKTDIVDCPYGLAEVLKLRPRKYQLVNSQLEKQGDDNINLGFIAQEIMEHIPECVNYLGDEANTPNEKGWARAYALDTNEVVAVLTKAIQELAAKVAVLESKT